MTMNYLPRRLKPIKMMLWNVADVTLRQPTVIWWQFSRHDDANDRTLNYRLGHNYKVRLKRDDNWWFALLLKLALEHPQYFDLPTSRAAFHNRPWLASRQTSKSKFKLRLSGMRRMGCPLINVQLYIFWIYSLVSSCFDKFGQSNLVRIQTVL